MSSAWPRTGELSTVKNFGDSDARSGEPPIRTPMAVLRSGRGGCPRPNGTTAEATREGVKHLFYSEARLLGVSVFVGRARLLRSEAPGRRAHRYFTFGTTREVAVMANTAEELDRLIFTGGIGEHSTEIRAAFAMAGSANASSRNQQASYFEVCRKPLSMSGLFVPVALPG